MTKQATIAGTMATIGAQGRRRHRSAIGTAALLVVLATFGMTGTAAAAPTGGNAPAAKACQKNGYTTLARAESPTVAFTSSDECTAYAAEGGTLVPLQTVNLDAFRDACEAVGGDYDGPFGDTPTTVFFQCFSFNSVPVEDQQATLEAACAEMNGNLRFLANYEDVDGTQFFTTFSAACGGLPVPS